MRGFDSNVHARLRPFVTALPQPTAVNVNTAAPEVLAALAGGWSLDGARCSWRSAGARYFRDRAEFVSRLPAGVSVAQDDIAVASSYFLATMRVTIGGAQAGGTALLAREDGRWPAVVWRKLL